jgi:hypothetical protein
MSCASPLAFLSVRRIAAWAVALAVLLTILAHAVTPVSVPMERGKGSAFSAATADVSLLTAAPALKKATAQKPSPAPSAWRPADAAPMALAAGSRVPTERRSIAARAPPDRALLTAILPAGPPAA